MKKILSIKHLTMLFLICLWGTLSVSAINIEGINYTLDYETKTASVTYNYYVKYHGDIIIPEKVLYGGVWYKVTSIELGAFSGSSGLTSIIIPKSINSIGCNAFENCIALKKLIIEDGTTSIDIDNVVFTSCPLESVYLGRNISYHYAPVISDYSPFRNCKSLKILTIGNEIRSLSLSTDFSSCSGLQELIIKDSNEAIQIDNTSSSIKNIYLGRNISDFWNDHPFQNYFKLESLTIGSNVTYIPSFSFSQCGNLKQITIKDGGDVLYFGDNSSTIPFSSSPIASLYLGRNISYNNGNSPFKNKESLTSLTISNSVTSIREKAFSNCTGLTSLSIPASITSFDDAAFRGCTGLTSIHISDIAAWCKILFGSSGSNPLFYAHHLYMDGKEITVLNMPTSVTAIGNSAFQNCSGLTSVTIPNSVTCIGESAFQYCSGLTSLTIPNSVTTIGESAFSGCSGLPSLAIPNSVTSIGQNAFEGCSSLTSVTIPNSVTSIGNYAFSGCSGLTSLTIPNSVTSIGNKTFSNCSGLTSLTIPNSVTSIGSSAFRGCSGLTSLKIEDGSETLSFSTSYSSTPFTSCPLQSLYLGRNISYSDHYSPFKSLTSVTIGNSVTSIGDYAFSGCSGLTSLTIPNSVTSIGSSAFADCSGLTSLAIENGSETLSFSTSYSSTPFASCPLQSLYLGRNISYNSSYYSPFKGKASLTSLTIDNSVTSIGDYAFSGCSGLTSLTIPNSITSIGSSAFSGCSGLASLTIPNSVTTIGDHAFSDCSGLTSVHISDLASWCNISFGDSSANPLYIAHHLILNGTEVESLTIPNSINSINAFTFCGGSNLTVVTIPSSVTSIERYAFQGCSGLTSLTIPNSVTYIGSSAFKGCSGLLSVTISSSVTTIGESAFSECSGLPLLTIPNSVMAIGESAFSGCSGLTSVTIPNSVTSIERYTFSGCSALTSLTIPNCVTSIGWGAFYKCNNLTSVSLSCAEIGSYFADSKNTVETLTLGEGVKVIKPSAFEGFSAITSLQLPQSIETVGEKAFNQCGSLTEIRIGKEIHDVGSMAFANCQKLEDVWCYAVKYPTTATDAFQDSYIDYVTLHVPKAGVAQYGKQEPWSGFMAVVPIEAPEPSNITLSDAGYATYYDKYFDTELPSGVRASVVTKATDSKLTYKVIADGAKGEVVPAGVAVLLEGVRRSADTYTLKPTEASATYTGANLLHGSNEATTTTADGDCLFYKLAYGPSGTELSKVLGWYWGEDDGRAFTIEGHKAWLAIPQTSAAKPRALFYSIEGDALTLEMESLPQSLQGEESPWYDLQGRRVESPTQRGVYIRDGKKVYVK